MWRVVTGEERKEYERKAAALMKDPDAFKTAMVQATVSWPFSCEHNLTSMASNRIAWLGHAGSVIATGAPEDITRAAWWTLTPAQQDEANRVAAEALHMWEDRYTQSRTTERPPNG